ncbi:MAG: glutathione S-transferase N-terminal domain-containing protein [Xanthobacteraceae bacterium]
MQYRLYCTQGSGNSYKVALYLNCAGLDWEPVGVKLADGQTRDAAWRAAMNPMGEVPVLEWAGQRMSQSGAILLWLAETHGQFAFDAGHASRRYAGCSSTITNSRTTMRCTGFNAA